jgi:hypothetical protein
VSERETERRGEDRREIFVERQDGNREWEVSGQLGLQVLTYSTFGGSCGRARKSSCGPWTLLAPHLFLAPPQSEVDEVGEGASQRTKEPIIE